MNTVLTRLAWRLWPPKKKTPIVATPALIVVGSALILIGLPASLGWETGGFIVLGFGIAVFLSAFVLEEKAIIPTPLPEGPEGYELATALLRTSVVELERAHVYVGTFLDSLRRTPFLLHDELIRMHVLVLGATGRNKTHRGVIPMCLQLLEMGKRSLIYIDLKGDNAAFRILEAKAKKLGIPVYYFSLEKGEAGCLMNLLNDPAFLALSDNQKAQLLAQAAGLEAGEAFGAGYFGSLMEMFLKRCIAFFLSAGYILSFAALRAFVAHPSARKILGMSRRDFENASHVPTIFEKLSEDPRLNVTGVEPIDARLFANAITVDKVIEGPCVVYLKLPALTEPTTARVIARLFPRLVLARLMTWKGERVEHIYTVIDEAQEMLQRGILTPIKQARSFGMSFIFVLQNMSDLKRDGADFTSAIVNNTAVKFIMSMKDKEGRDYLTNSAGEKLRVLSSSSSSKTATPNGDSISTGTQDRQEMAPIYGPDELNFVNARTSLAVVESSPMSGYTRIEHPEICEIPFPMSEEQFACYDLQGWPEPDGVMSALAADIPDFPPPPVAAAPAPDNGPDKSPPALTQRRRRRPKPIDPEEAERAARLAETLRHMAGK